MKMSDEIFEKHRENWHEGTLGYNDHDYECTKCGISWTGRIWVEHGVYSAPDDESDICPECGEVADV